jgi:hypothetical protein
MSRGSRFREAAALTALAVVLAVSGHFAWLMLVREGILKYNQYDRRERGRLKVGSPAPDLVLSRYDGDRVRLSELWREKPVVLIFGSCT